ncbi:FecR family protein [Sphingobacterium yanglingense]|uniref:FecR family protein n=1 Tax=Sphingobacterium yanglingense TaxID=1437280 RepID=A0A4R6WM05_9SPHI|nr:FecR family protein [Sphingobacterium yanglingense]TDQ79365.1 FecR family protein [Sphingobacterium yanglingense]
MEDKEIEKLWKKYIDGTCTEQEKKTIQQWYNKAVQDNTMLQFTDDIYAVGDQMWTGISQELATKKSGPKIWRWAGSVAAAAIGILSLLYITNMERPEPITVANTQHILPNEEGAILTLADGREFTLDEQNGLTQYIDTGKVLAEERFTVTTPKGKSIRLLLPDGSSTVLNPSSVLSYAYNAVANVRELTISGEAYFDVAKRRDQKSGNPIAFSVRSKGQLVRVLGTRFSVASYDDELVALTTLEEGSVAIEDSKLGGSKVLKPGQQAVLSAQGIQVKEVDLDIALAWKDNDFAFSNQSLESLLKQLERWYDVSFIWKDKKYKNESFDGMIPRDRSLYEVLNALERTGKVKFEIQGRNILVK